jgi:hypothetical protein
VADARAEQRREVEGIERDRCHEPAPAGPVVAAANLTWDKRGPAA